MEIYTSSRTPLSGDVVLLTGAGGSIGNTIHAALIELGVNVIATNLSGNSSGLTSDWIQHDVTSVEDWKRVVGYIRDRYGRLDCLINSAAICPIERIENTSLELWRKVSRVNVESVLLGMQTSLPLLCESGSVRAGGASIVNLSSVAGVRGVPFAGAYCASKGAVTLLTKAAAKEFAFLKYPIRVNSVHPGSVESPMMDANFARFVEVGAVPSIAIARERAMERNPMGRLARPEEVAGAVVFLCSSASSFMNGSEVVIDGGASA